MQSAAEQQSALLLLAAGIGDALPALRRNIWRCIHAEDARLVDAASPRLAEVRGARARNRSELRSTLDGWARTMLGRGASERAQARPPLLCSRVKGVRLSQTRVGHWYDSELAYACF